jgi:glycosyltransferase involved in cell wall biosynthesis
MKAATIGKITRPRIGFTGTIDDRIYLDLIDFILNHNQNWAIILIGTVNKSRVFQYLREKRNVYFLGWKDNMFLPAYINTFDVCIIPYKMNEFTKGISPIKAFEYLALGKPVVATDLPALRSLKANGLIKIAKDKEEFLSHLNDYLVNDDQNIKNDRIEFAKTNTWQKRIDEISKIINTSGKSDH